MASPDPLNAQGPETEDSLSAPCRYCRYWKYNCSKERPSCLRCRHRDLECIYEDERRNPGESSVRSPSGPSSSNQVGNSAENEDSGSNDGDSELGDDDGALEVSATALGKGPLQDTPAQGGEEAHLSHAAAIEPEEESVKLYRIGAGILGVFKNLVTLEKPEWPESQHWLDSESQRFRLWAYSLGLHRLGHASLDYRVRDVTVVRDRFADILDSLRDHLDNLLSVMRGERRPLEEGWNEEDSSDTGQPSASSMYGTTGSSDSFHEVDFRQRSVNEAVDALYSLAAKIRNPRNRPQRTTRELYKHIPSHLRDSYIQDREETEISVVRHVQNQHIAELWSSTASFENREFFERHVTTENFLVRRTGIANARRKQQFVYWKEHAARIRHGTTARTPVALDDSLEQEHLIREPVGDIPVQAPGGPPQGAPSNPDRSLATSATRLGDSFTGFDDLRSVTTHQTRLSTAVRPQGGKLNWPPPPRQPADIKYFTCPYCHIICPKGYLSKDAWRSHLIRDLMPYHCTYETCSDPNRLYGSYQEWLNHESLHTRVWHCRVHEKEFETESGYIQHLQQDHPQASPEIFSPELVAAAVGPASKPRRDCPLCPKLFRYSDIGEMRKHMRYHLEHLALFSLPADPGDVEDDASERSSDSHQAIQRSGRQDSLELDFDGSGPSSIASTTDVDPSAPDPQPSADQTALDDIRRLSEQGPSLVDPTEPVHNWLANQPNAVSHAYHANVGPNGPPAYLREGYKPPIWLGWGARWSDEENCWFYVEEATGLSQWEAPCDQHLLYIPDQST